MKERKINIVEPKDNNGEIVLSTVEYNSPSAVRASLVCTKVFFHGHPVFIEEKGKPATVDGVKVSR